MQRGRSALRLGRSDRALQDFRETIRQIRAGARLSRQKTIQSYIVSAAIERRSGNIKNAEELYLEFIEKQKGVGVYRHIVDFYIDIGNIAAAEKYRDRALDRIDRIASSPRMSKVKRDMFSYFKSQIEGTWNSAIGKWSEAERHYRIALAAAKSHAKRIRVPYIAITTPLREGLTESLIEQSRFLEAEIYVRKSLNKSLRFGKFTNASATNVILLARVMAAQGRHEEAETLLRAGLDILEAADDTDDLIVIAEAKFELGRTKVFQSSWQEAAAEFTKARGALTKESRILYEEWAKRDTAMPLALIMSGQTERGHRVIANHYEQSRATLGSDHVFTAEKEAVLALALAAKDDREGALVAFRKSLPLLMQASGKIGAGSASAQVTRLDVLLKAYIKLLSEIDGTRIEQDNDIDAAAEAFRMADALRSRSVQAALAASSARTASGKGELSDLIRKEQDARQGIAALRRLVTNAMLSSAKERDVGLIRSLKVRIEDLRAAHAAIAEELRDRFPKYAELIKPSPATIDAARGSLRPGEAMVATHMGEDRLYIWAFGRAGKVAFGSTEMGREDLTDLVGNLRLALDPKASTLGDIPRFNVLAAHELYRTVLAPVKAGWQGARDLIVVAHGALAQIPFSVMVTRDVSLSKKQDALFANYRQIPWLVRDHSVTMLPSASSLANLRSTPQSTAKRRSFAGFGDPFFNSEQTAAAVAAKPATAAAGAKRNVQSRGLPVRMRSALRTRASSSANLSNLPRLPDTRLEVQSIARAMNADLSRDVFLGAAASEKTVKTMDLSQYRVLAFATHGLVPGDLDGLLQPALALSSPAVSGSGGDGLLKVDEILNLKLNADWVVLSACNTAAGGEAGAEAYSGLGQAFFYAGTRALLLSNWPVETTSARELSTDIFRRQASDPGLPRSEALRQAMLALIDGPGFIDKSSNKLIFSYAHPIFWAPFSLVGDGRGGNAGS